AGTLYICPAVRPSFRGFPGLSARGVRHFGMMALSYRSRPPEGPVAIRTVIRYPPPQFTRNNTANAESRRFARFCSWVSARILENLMPTIALVDDDRNILASVSIALESEGYRVQTYTDGASALDGFQATMPDLAILDIKMPRMDGMELLRRLRQKTDLPVIFLTSKDDEIDELFGLKMGADDFIKKPFSQRLLVERVKAVLRRFQTRDPAEKKGEET